MASARRSDITELPDRLVALGLTTWLVDDAGVITPAEADDPASNLFRCRRMAGAIARAAGEAVAGGQSCIEAAAGCRFIGIQLSGPQQPRLVVLAVEPEAADGPWLQDRCRDAGVPVERLAERLRERSVSQRELSRLETTIRFLRDDDQARRNAEQLSASFSDELTTSYETLDLLYTISRSMSETLSCEQFVNRVLDELRKGLMFAWTGALFTKEAGKELAGRAFVSGDLGAATTWFKADLDQERLEQEGRPENRKGDVARFLGPRGTVQPIISESRRLGVLVVGGRMTERQITSYELQAIRSTAQHMAAYVEIAILYAEQREAFYGTLRALTAAIDAKDAYTCGHSERVAHLARLMAEEMGLPAEDADRLEIAGLVHDVGKIGVPEAVLKKPAKLTVEEFGLIKLHPEIGFRILRGIKPLAPMLPAVLHHHERWDGRGYPHGLAGEMIPLDARILAVCDTFDAMSSNRSYRPAIERRDVLAEIERCAGSQFDPDLVGPFLRLDFGGFDALVSVAAERSAAAQHRAA